MSKVKNPRKVFSQASSSGSSSSSVSVLIKDTTRTTAHTGNTNETLLFSKLIPSGSVSVGDILKVVCFVEKIGPNDVTWRAYLNTSATLAGALLISSARPGFNNATSILGKYLRVVASNNTEIQSPGSNMTSPYATVLGATYSTVNVNWTANQYLIISGQLDVGTDSAQYVSSFITKL